MLSHLINFNVLHLAIACYNVLYYYTLLDDKNNYSNNYIVYNNYKQIKFLINTNLKLVFHKELLFRIYLVELMKFIINENELIIIWMILFSSFNAYYHNYHSNIMKIGKFIYTFIISYYLINNSILMSGLIHCYTELLGITIQKKLFKFFNNNKPIINKLKEAVSPNIELASKEEVEELLSTKKMN